MGRKFVPVNPAVANGKVNIAVNDPNNGNLYPVYNIAFGAEEEVPDYVSNTTPLPTTPDIEKTAFGETAVAELTPTIQIQFPYSINPAILKTLNNGGTSSIENSMAKMSTGAAANQTAEINTLESIQYHPGQGTLNRFTGLFTTGVAGSEQVIGIGNAEDAIAFGYNGADFGILHRKGGSVVVQELDITTFSTTAENVTVTLDGDTASVPVTVVTDIYETAQEIADFDYSGIGRGWDAHSEGDGKIKFISYDSEVKAGAFTLTATTAVGTFSELVAGVDPTDVWHLQTDWNGDKADGTGVLPILDPTKGNVYEIRYQWLGFGPIYCYIENPVTGAYIVVHTMRYANANTIPSLNNPTLPLFMRAQNTSNTTDIIVRSASMAAFTEGKVSNTHFHRGFDIDYSKSGTAEVPIFTIHNKDVFFGKRNRIRVKLILLVANANANKSSTIRVRKDSILSGASYTDIETSVSVVEVDSSSTVVTNGSRQLGIGMGRTSEILLDLENKSYILDPGDKFTVTIQPQNVATEGTISVNWEELH